jgi:murein DD-endopeptidase MepM/ murein hydrolase activator NlpD
LAVLVLALASLGGAAWWVLGQARQPTPAPDAVGQTPGVTGDPTPSAATASAGSTPAAGTTAVTQPPAIVPTPTPSRGGGPADAPTVAVPFVPRPAGAGFIDTRRYSYEQGWGTLEVQRFLDGQPGTLKTAVLPAGAQRISLASAVADQALLYSVNPKVMLTLLEMESGMVRDPQPAPNQIGWAMGYRQQPAWGLGSQLNWAARELFRAARDDPGGMVAGGFGAYAVSRLLAMTVDSESRGWSAARTATVFVQTYWELFGEDPAQPLRGAPSPATGPFLRQPYEVKTLISSAFDHEFPVLRPNGTMLPYRGTRDQTDYDGHDGWDFALSTGNRVVAAAAGRVLVAGWSDDECGAPAGAVIIDHDNGYRTLYWHLSTVAVPAGSRVVAGDLVGLSGANGCAIGAHLHFGVQYLGRSTDPNGWCTDGAVKADPWAAHPAGTSSRWLWTDKASPCPNP